MLVLFGMVSVGAGDGISDANSISVGSNIESLVRRIYVWNRLTKLRWCRSVSVSLVNDADVQLVRKRVAGFVEGREIACLLYRFVSVSVYLSLVGVGSC